MKAFSGFVSHILLITIVPLITLSGCGGGGDEVVQSDIVHGKLALPAGDSVSNYTIFYPSQAVNMSSGGVFGIKAAPDKQSPVYAVSNDGRKVYAAWITGLEKSIILDVRSTAEVLVLLNPLLSTGESKKKALLLGEIKKNNEVGVLASVIDVVYDTVAQPLSDPRIATATATAVASVSRSANNVAPTAGLQTSRLNGSNPVAKNSTDKGRGYISAASSVSSMVIVENHDMAALTLERSANSVLMLEPAITGPLGVKTYVDWVAEIVELDPVKVQSSSVLNRIIFGVSEINALDNLAKDLGYRGKVIVRGEVGLSGVFDFFSDPVGYFVGEIFPAQGIKLENKGIYAVIAFSGGPRFSDDSGGAEFDAIMSNSHQYEMWSAALAMNVVRIAQDAVMLGLDFAPLELDAASRNAVDLIFELIWKIIQTQQLKAVTITAEDIGLLVQIATTGLYDRLAPYLHRAASDLSSSAIRKFLHIAVNVATTPIDVFTGAFSLTTRLGNLLYGVTPREAAYVLNGSIDEIVSHVFISSTNIPNGAIGVPVDSVVSATFGQSIENSTLSASTFTLSGPNGLVQGDVTYNPSTLTATATPFASLAGNATYTVTITTGVRALTGASLVSNYSWSFTTASTDPGQTVAIGQVIDNVGVSTGALAQGATTDDATPTLSGSLSAVLTSGQSLRIFTNGTIVGTAAVNGTTWTFTPAALVNGVYSFTAVVVGAAGLEDNRSAAWNLTINSTSPLGAAPTVSTVNPTSMVANGVTQLLSISGSNFTSGNIVQFMRGAGVGANVWSTASTSVNVPSANQISTGLDPRTVNDTIRVRVCRSSSQTADADCSAGTQAVAVTAPPKPFGIAAGHHHTCALTAAGGVKCWGRNLEGHLGDGTRTDRLTPVGVSGLSTGVAAIAAGGGHTCALTTAGGVKCWGRNLEGQVGAGGNFATVPIDVLTLGSGAASVVANWLHTCALTTLGSAKCWGRNIEGQVGDSTFTNRPTPVDVSGLGSGVTALGPGGSHTSCAVTIGGGVTCWGNNTSGELGDRTLANRALPVAVFGLSSGVTAVTVGNGHTCALTDVGGVKCWGGNLEGQLGNGTTTNSATPTDVVGLSGGVTTVATSFFHTCALTSTGGVKCWGDNAYGQLGDGTLTDRLAPVDVVGLTSGVAAISTGSGHSCALMTAGNVKCWGHNYLGALGDGTLTDRLTPADVVGF